MSNEGISMRMSVFAILLMVAIAVAPATAQTFDNSGGGSWKEYMSFPITTVPNEYAQYKIVINGTTWELYNVTGSLEASGSNNDFWSLVNSTGADIRVFNQNGAQLYFWIEKWDYTNKTAIIWVNLTAGSTELNIAYGNPSALPSSYNNGTKTFEFFDDFEDGDYSGWTILNGGGTGTASVVQYDGRYMLKLAPTNNLNRVAAVHPFNATGNYIVETLAVTDATVSDGFQIGFSDGTMISASEDAPNNGYIFAFARADNQNHLLFVISGGVKTALTQVAGSASSLTYYDVALEWSGNTLKGYINGNEVLSATDSTFTRLGYIHISCAVNYWYFDWVRVLKLADPADFGTPIVKSFQKKFGTKTVYVNVTYLDTVTTSRYNPTAYYKLEDKPQINVTSQLSVSGVNATYGANISIELIDFVTLDNVVYNGTDVTANLTYLGTITNSTTGYVYNVYEFTTYENGTLEIYGHVNNKAYETVYKLDGMPVDIFNTTAVIGEPLEIVLPHRGNVTIGSQKFVNVSSVTINTKDLGIGVKDLTITIDDPENFTVGCKYGTLNVTWGSVKLNITDINGKPFNTAFGIFNRNFNTLSTDSSKIYAGDNVLSLYYCGIKLKEVEFHLNHTNNGLIINVTVNATQFKDYRDVTRVIVSPNAFSVISLSDKYPYSVMKIVNCSNVILVNYINNPPTAVKVEGATSYSYEKPVLKIIASGNVTVTDLYKLSIYVKDRLGNPLGFTVTVNGSNITPHNGMVALLLKPSTYVVEVPTSYAGFELWKFNNTSNIAIVEVNHSDIALPSAEYRIPTKIETTETRIQKVIPWFPFPIPFLGKSKKPEEYNTTIVRLEGSVRDFYNAPVPHVPVTVEIISPNYTRIYNVTTDESGNFKIDVDMARGVEYKVTYKFAGDDVYVGSSTTKTFMIEQLPTTPAPISAENTLMIVAIAVGAIAVVGGVIYLAKRTKAQARVRMESEFRFFRRLK